MEVFIMSKMFCKERLDVMKSIIKGFIINYLNDNREMVSELLEKKYSSDENRDMVLFVEVDVDGKIEVGITTDMEYEYASQHSKGILCTLDSRKGFEADAFLIDTETGEESTYAEGGVLYLAEHEDYIFSMLDYFVGNAVDNYFINEDLV